MDLFKRGVGQTMVQYIIRRRLDTALSTLVSTERKVAEIAFQAASNPCRVSMKLSRPLRDEPQPLSQALQASP
jgi:transcriptional regulator GlxA family with amidase domain